MNKYEALICTGKLEILLQDQEQMLKEIHQLQSYIVGNDYVNAGISRGKLDELCSHSGLSKEVFQNLKNLSNFVNTEKEMIPNTKLEEKVLNTEIMDLNLSVRTYNYLMRAGVRTVGDYLNLDPNEKQKIAGKNKKIIPEVDEKVSHFWVEI
jgi:hypothetical protein